ncbi:MAG: hypothetical protein K0R67_1747 [Paenibacillus sp.]|nr:hypothetical protein [Paenibacillus sp.]
MFMNWSRLAALLLLLIIIVPAHGYASSSTEQVRVFLNGEQVLFTQLPVVEEGITLVQVRPLYEALGLKLQWDEETHTITSTRDDWKIVMKIDSKEAKVNDSAVTLDIPPKIIEGNTFVPLRFVGESIGGEVIWEESTQHVNIINDNGYRVYLAVMNNDIEEARRWLAQYGGADFANKYDGLTSLSIAMYHHNHEMVELLLSYGADPNRCCYPPLLSAVLDGDPTIVQLLIEYGADVSFPVQGKNALEAARQELAKATDPKNREKIVTILENGLMQQTSILADTSALIPVNIGKTVNIISGETGDWGYLDQNGNLAIKAKFAYALHFSEGLAYAVTKDGRMSGYIDRTGKYVITFNDKKNWFPGPFHDGLAPVGTNKQYGYIDRKGDYVIAPEYQFAGDFSEGFAAVQKDRLWGFIDRNGKMVVAPEYDMVDAFHNGLALVRGRKSGFIDSTGKLVIDFSALGISEYGRFAEEFAAVRQDDKVGYIDRNGKWVIPPQYELGQSFDYGVAVVKLEGSFGLIDKSGVFVVKPQYKYATFLYNGLVLVQKDDKWGVIDKSGKWVIPAEYDRTETLIYFFPLLGYESFNVDLKRMTILYKGSQVYYIMPDGTTKTVLKK